MNSQRFFPGGLAIAVPGEVSGQYKASKLYGKLPWKDLVQPAIDLARDGFLISNALADAMKDEFKKIKRDKGLRWEPISLWFFPYFLSARKNAWVFKADRVFLFQKYLAGIVEPNYW